MIREMIRCKNSFIKAKKSAVIEKVLTEKFKI